MIGQAQQFRLCSNCRNAQSCAISGRCHEQHKPSPLSHMTEQEAKEWFDRNFGEAISLWWKAESERGIEFLANENRKNREGKK